MKNDSSGAQMIGLIWRASRRQSVIVIAFTLCGAIAEAVSLAVVPFLMSLSLGGSSNTFANIDLNTATLGADADSLIFYAIIAFVIIFCLKTVFLSFVVWIQARFIYGIKKIFSQDIFDIYLKEDYEKSLLMESNKKVSNLTIEMHAFIVNFLFPCVSLLTEALVVCAMIFVAVLLQPWATASAIGILGASMFLLDRFTRKRLTNWGMQRAEGESGKVQAAQQAFDSFKEIKIASSYQYFGDLFGARLEGTREVETKELALSQMPRLWLEAIAVIALAAVVLVSAASGRAMGESLAATGLFALMAFRLMPSANRIIVALQKIRFSQSTLEFLLSILGDKKPDLALQVDQKFDRNWGKISFEHVDFGYGEKGSKGLRNISFDLIKGECIGIVGPSGVGKSTLLDIALSLLHPKGGAVTVDDQPLADVQAGWRQSIGYVPQLPLLVSGSVSVNVAFGTPENLIDFEKVDEALRAAGMPEFGGNFARERQIGERGNALSGGQRQRISIARALYRDPDVIFFDEATSSLDTESGMAIITTIEKLKGRKTIVMVTHHEYPLTICDRVFRLDGRGIAEITERGVRK